MRILAVILIYFRCYSFLTTTALKGEIYFGKKLNLVLIIIVMM